MQLTVAQVGRWLIPALVLALFSSCPATGQSVPSTLNYQGRLTDNSPQQNPVSGTVSITFAIYAGPSGGSALWSESWPAVPVNQGILSVVLGSNGTPVPASVFETGTERYLEVVANGETLTPRQRISSVAYANRAERAADADGLAGQPASAWQKRVTGSCPPGSSIASVAEDGTVTCQDAGITSETDPKVGSLTGGKVPRWGSTSLADGTITDDGTNVGVGTAPSGAKLHVAGSVKIVDGSQAAGRVLTSDADGKGAWQAQSAGAGACPPGYVDAGDYCIEFNERSMAYCDDATLTCSLAGGHLCHYIELSSACMRGLINREALSEWTAESSTTDYMNKMSTSSCRGMGQTHCGSYVAYRCCISK